MDDKIAISGTGGRAGIWVYSLDTRSYRCGETPEWLSDNRRLVYAHRDRLWVVDTTSSESKEVLAVQGETLGNPVPIAGDSQLVFVRSSRASDVWTVRFDQK